MRQESATTQKQDKAIAALLSEPTIKAAAERAGVGERTLQLWLRDDAAFNRAYGEARRAAVMQSIARLQQTTWAAVAVLHQVAADKRAPASARVAAASKILDYALKGIEGDVSEQIAELQAAIDKLQAEICQQPFSAN